MDLLSVYDEHLFFVFGPFQKKMVSLFIEEYSLDNCRVFDVLGFEIREGEKKISFNDLYNYILRNKKLMVYIPQINSIFSNMLYSNKELKIANIPDGLSNLIQGRPSPANILIQYIKKIYCLLIYRKKFTVCSSDLIGYSSGRFSFIVSPYPNLVWDKSCPIIPVPLPWHKNVSKSKLLNNRVAFVVGQPLENIMSLKMKNKLMNHLCAYAQKLDGVETVYYIRHPSENTCDLSIPKEVIVKRLSGLVEPVVVKSGVKYCLGISSFSLVNIKTMNESINVYYHLASSMPYKFELKKLYDKLGMREA